MFGDSNDIFEGVLDENRSACEKISNKDTPKYVYLYRTSILDIAAWIVSCQYCITEYNVVWHKCAKMGRDIDIPYLMAVLFYSGTNQ